MKKPRFFVYDEVSKIAIKWTKNGWEWSWDWIEKREKAFWLKMHMELFETAVKMHPTLLSAYRELKIKIINEK